MHYALEIQDILCSILDYCAPVSNATNVTQGTNPASDLASLARTCRAFKEPALDVLWSVLLDLSPLARCVPEASHESSKESIGCYPLKEYSFTRPLTQTEWDILRGYTRRVQSIRDFYHGLDWDSVACFLNQPPTEPLFPNLHALYCVYTQQTMPLLCVPLPSLVDLEVLFQDKQLFQNSHKAFLFSPNIRKLSVLVRLDTPGTLHGTVELDYIYRWMNIRSLVLPQVAMGADALVQLSRLPALTQADFALSAALPASHSHLVFSSFHDLTLRSESMDPISRFLSWARLPAIAHFKVSICHCPSKQSFSSLLTCLLACASPDIEGVTLYQTCYHPDDNFPLENLLIGFEDLRPCMAFKNFRRLELNLRCDVELADGQMLALASAWPMLEKLQSNEEFGWNSAGGITPGGLVRLLQMCPLLRRLALRLDSRGYTEALQSHVPVTLGSTPTLQIESINVIDSTLGAESVSAVTTFFRGIGTCSKSPFSVSSWTGMRRFPDMLLHVERWIDVQDRVNDTLC